MDTTYRFGIEEEFFLANAGTRGTPRRTIKASTTTFARACRR